MAHNHAMRWIWQQPDWPDFRYDNRALDDRELDFRINSERLAGRFEALPMASQEDATIDLMLSEAIRTSAIKGEDLDRESLRSSLHSLITSDTLPVDVRKSWQTPLTHDLLGKWQSMVVPEQRYTSILRGVYRTILCQCRLLAGLTAGKKFTMKPRWQLRCLKK